MPSTPKKETPGCLVGTGTVLQTVPHAIHSKVHAMGWWPAIWASYRLSAQKCCKIDGPRDHTLLCQGSP